MRTGNWDNIKVSLHEVLKTIFNDCNISLLSSYERRKRVFEYLCNNISYDYDLLNHIRNSNLDNTPIIRELYLELESVICNQKGICNAISQYYKLLLEEVGIKSICVICDDGTSVKHQLNLVYDDISGNYSFDDVTNVIVGRGTIDDFFDYDIKFANSVNQGNKAVLDDEYWVVLPDDYVNFLVGRQDVSTENISFSPENIVSLKSFHKK